MTKNCHTVNIQFDGSGQTLILMVMLINCGKICILTFLKFYIEQFSYREVETGLVNTLNMNLYYIRWITCLRW